MNFDFNEDQRALQDTVQRFVARDYSFEKRRAIRDAAPGWSREVWQALADLGVLALNIDEDYGGLGYGPQETGLVMGAFGVGLLLEPYLAGAVIAPALIRRAASADFQEEWLPNIATGETIVVLAHADARNAQVTEIGGNLNGRKAVVAHGGCADLLLVSAQTAQGRTELFAVTPGAEGVSLRDYPTLDGQRAADVILDNAPATRVGAGDTAAAIDAALDIGLAALCAEAVGIMDATIAATTDYLKTRQQFGRPIGRFQALQHRMADMLLHLEQARSMSYLAAMHLAPTTTPPHASARFRPPRSPSARPAASSPRIPCSFTDGMGMTDELILSHWFKRLTAIEMCFGDTDFHLQRFSRLSRAA